MPGVSAGAGTTVSVGVVDTTCGGSFQYDAIYYTSVGMQYDAGVSVLVSVLVPAPVPWLLTAL